MFYIQEIFFRSQYLMFSFIITALLVYGQKHLLLFLLTLPLFEGAIFDNSQYFIYTNPTELLSIYINNVFLFCFLFLFPYFIWQLVDFFKSSLFALEHNKLKFYLFSILISFSFINLLSFLLLFPNVWFFFTYFNTLVGANSLLNFFFELKAQEYFIFVSFFSYSINSTLLVLFFLFSTLFLFGLKKVFSYKKIIVVFNLIAATLLSTPEIFSQILIFFGLTILSELFIFFYSLCYLCYINFNVAQIS